MALMKDSKLNEAWLRDIMAKYPPSIRPNGTVFSGPVRLAFVNIFEPGKPGDDGGDGKYGAALLFPPGTNMDVFKNAWLQKAKEEFAKNFDASGNPVGLHLPFHRQDDKTVGLKPYSGFTPGGYYFACTSKYQPSVVDPPGSDGTKRQVIDPKRIYPGVWALVGMNVYSYRNKKTGVAFGMQTVMIIADDSRLAGGGGDPDKDFAGITISSASNINAAFDGAATQQQNPAIMGGAGHVGQAGNLPITQIGSTSEIDALLG